MMQSLGAFVLRLIAQLFYKEYETFARSVFRGTDMSRRGNPMLALRRQLRYKQGSTLR